MITLASPAKINLFLRVLRRRPDGYHELASLFQAIDLCDLLHIAPAKQDSLTCTDPAIPLDHTNLILKATKLFRRKTALDIAVEVHLEKRIPMEAGLGGGSSNAATTLWALNEISGRPATLAQLMSWASEIGSDVSFFLSQGLAYCTGRGEILRPLTPLSSQHLHIIKPAQGLSTPKIYGQLNVHALEPRDPELILRGFLTGNPVYFNDLEVPAFQAMPELAHLKARLQSLGFTHVVMSGSGSAFFCLGDSSICHHDYAYCTPASFMYRSPDAWYTLG